MSINNKLITFAQQELVLSHNDIERERINASLAQLEKVLKNKLLGEVKEITRFGSFTRNTILPRKYDNESDVDLLVVFNTTSGRYTPGTYRKKLHDTLILSYPNSFSKKDFPAVKLELNHIMFDVVPAYCEVNYLGNKSYFIPGASDNWQSTIPNEINNDLAQKNQSYGNNIVRNVIRLCKHWNASAGYVFETYGMEKWILNRFFYHGDNLYDKFLSILNDMAGTKPGVRQALDYIQQYKGSWNQPASETKQFEWLQKLLPGLK
jgi:predicted nucleotidyltransferase